MSQQRPPSRPRKGFLVIGIVLLLSSFFFFYWASRLDSDYVTFYDDEVNLAHSMNRIIDYPQFGYSYEYYPKPYDGVIMQPNDVLTVSCSNDTQINGTFNIVLWERELTNDTLLTYASTFVSYKNEQPNEILVVVYLYAQNVQNVTLSTTTTLNHYETPQWGCFGAGVVLSSLAVIPIFKSKK